MEIYDYVIIEAVLSLIIATIIILFYVRKGTNKLVTIISLITWFLNFYMVVLLPYDICITNKQKRNQNLTEAELKTSKAIEISYKIIYWTTFFIAWGVIPLLKSYESSGEFTRWERFKYSVKSNLILYGVELLICILLFIWAYFKLKKEIFSFFFKNIYNFSYVVGLLLMLLLLSYSLVKLPMQLYEKVNYEKTIEYYEYTANYINEKLDEVKTDLNDNAKKLLATIEDSNIMKELKDDNVLNDDKKNSNDKLIYGYQSFLQEKFDYLSKNAKIFGIKIKNNTVGSKEEPIKDKKNLVQLMKDIINGE